ncbi:MAG: hypothetical protein KKE29_19910 [Proteobacteria bacterium]|nr:hypothetical protein [Pseudomonadota bacterium]MBU4574425.1 hypothetical protein [Pseudomonadota bacterium]MBV1715956.1 hypothetical protein [Desulfarculus sp.]
MEPTIVKLVFVMLGLILSILSSITLYLVRKTATNTDRRLSAIEKTQGEHIRTLQALTERLLKDYPDKEDCDKRHFGCDRLLGDHETRIRVLEHQAHVHGEAQPAT